jgi:hypothetical protein
MHFENERTKAKEQGNSPEIDVLRTNAPDDPFSVDKERSSACEMEGRRERHPSGDRGCVDSSVRHNMKRFKSRRHDHDHDHDHDPDQPRQQERQTDKKRKTQISLDSPGTRPMNALSTL